MGLQLVEACGPGSRRGSLAVDCGWPRIGEHPQVHSAGALRKSGRKDRRKAGPTWKSCATCKCCRRIEWFDVRKQKGLQPSDEAICKGRSVGSVSRNKKGRPQERRVQACHSFAGRGQDEERDRNSIISR